MECNKEEAVRAKALAEKKMQCRDFIGARKMVLKAQHLFPDLENVSQMLTVCQVHCSAETKVMGSEDWYGILQVEPTADESLIKKQYRKLALLLHPDKNKFAGAEAAFKLVGEAHRTLSDKSKRSIYDLKRSAGVKTVVLNPQPRQQGKPSDTRKQPPAPSCYANPAASFANLNQTQATHQQQTQAAFGSLTFWTMCPSCGIRYQYYRTIINKALRCQNCLKPFIAHELSVQGVHGAVNVSFPVNKPVFSQQNDYQGNGVKTTKQQSKGEGPGGHSVLQPDAKIFSPGCSQKQKESDEVENGDAGKRKVKFEQVNLGKPSQAEPNVQPSGNANQKRGRKMVVESSDSDSTDSETTIKESEPAVAKNEGTSGKRRSLRQKQSVSYAEDNSDADESKRPADFKRLRKNSSPHSDHQPTKPSSGVDVNKVEVPIDATPVSPNKSVSTKREGNFARHGSPNENNSEATIMKESGDRKCQDKAKAISEEGMSAKSSSNMNDRKLNTTFLDYPDPEFYDFDNDRSPKCFAVGQIWSLYDYVDGMPRFYALIRSVSSSGFKLRFTWLEYFPVGQAEKDWADEELPVGCGVFRLGRTETTEDSRVFSHLMPWSKGPKRNPYLIYPRKGEVWALFKDWDLKWSLDPDQHRQYDYELVEVLSDFAADAGADVVPLIKVKGFVSIFCRAGGGSPSSPVHIPHSELLRFSHMVPSYRMTGREREGIPEGFFELDSASLPITEEQASLNEVGPGAQDPCRENRAARLDDQARGSKASDGQAGRGAPSSSADAAEQDGHGSPPDLQSPTYIVYQDSEFYDFDLDRVKDRFQAGQIWALYCEDDGFPKYYGYVRKVDSEDFMVHLTWLEACPQSEQEARWSASGLPFGCGRFRPISGKEGKETYRVIETFSHLVQQTEPSQRRLLYSIYPQVNEVWAVFRNWSVDWELPDLERCSEKGEYDLVEVAWASDSAISGQVLEKVAGFKTLFRPRMRNGERVKMEIARHEFLRFSHRIPSFRMTEERGGKLRGFLELDPASVPEIILCSC